MPRVLSAALAILLVPASSIRADSVGYTLSGVTTANVFTGPTLPAEFPVGTPFSATVRWESNSAPLFLSSTQGQYRLAEFTLTLSGKSGKWTTSSLPDQPSFTLNYLGSNHELQFTSGWGPENQSNPTIEDLAPYSANLVLLDPTGKAIPSLAAAPGSLDLADWDPNTSYFKFYLNNAGSAFVSGKFLSIRSLFAPEISVKLPNGKPAVDGKSTQKFGKSAIGKKSKAQKFVVRNTGPVAIKNLKITTSGKANKDFLLSNPSSTTIAPGSSASFKVTFKPKANGTRTASLRITHSESGKNAFDIPLSGKGTKR